MRFLFTAIILSLILSAGCRHDGNDQRLVRIAELTETAPRQALEALDSISPEELSEGDRHLFDLLTIKARDKEYITHTSDSLILDVISYYDRHRDNPYYPEALYYGGRVYSDLGDYPTSLTYFHRALDELPDDTKQLNLKSAVLSQTGRLLNKMRMFKEAASCLEEGIKLYTKLRNEEALMYDAQLLGIIYQNDKCFPTDRKWLQQSRDMASRLNMEDSLVADLFIARSYRLCNQLDSAYLKIRGVPDCIPSEFKNNAYATACDIFMDLNMPDSATKYAYMLIHSQDLINKVEGYEVLLSPGIMERIGSDSLRNYLKDYRRLIDRIMNGHQPQLEVEQQAHYNYSLHERKAEKAMAKSSELGITLIIVISFMFAVCLFIYLIWRRKKIEYVHLQNRLSDLERLQKLTLINQEGSQMVKQSLGKHEEIVSKKSHDELIGEIRGKLKEMESIGETYKVPAIIIDSDVYKKLSDYISANRFVEENSDFWKELESIVLEASPYFCYHLQLLSGAPVKEQFYHMALLIKCGVSPTNITVIMNRSKGTISNTRANMAKLILGEKQGAQVMDSIIRIL